MSEKPDWEIPPEAQPHAKDWPFDLERALSAVVTLTSRVPEDAFTASILGTERGGSGVLINARGLILTIGYLVTEAEQIWIHTIDGRAVPGDVLAYDQETGFGLVQSLGKLGLPHLGLGRSDRLERGDPVIFAAGGGAQHALKAQVVARQEFAGYWEYLLDKAIFTAPAHPFWGGAALIGGDGGLHGIGSLHVQHSAPGGPSHDVNMVVPIDLLPPILDELLTYGRPNRPPRPWLGLYAGESDGQVLVAGLSEGGPAHRAGIRTGDRIHAVGEDRVATLAQLWRKIWAIGDAGSEIPLTVVREEGGSRQLRVKSADRASFLKRPRLH
jgi:S1-C subfamily serine protease